jgi:5-methyltetrahydrofolate--homocysteine methyltransferase
MSAHHSSTRPPLTDLLFQRILVMDGAMGTLIQQQKLSESEFRGEVFADCEKDQKGNNDLLCLTQPEVIQGLHHSYLSAGADVISTNTFNANRISLADYKMQGAAYEINKAAARIARVVADEFTDKDPRKPRYVAGSLGPTNRTASISPDVGDPAARNVTFDELVQAYHEQAAGLMDGGADVLMVETVFDTLNAKAALFALDQLFEERDEHLPIVVSGTITDASGRTLSGQTIEAFWASVSHLPLLAVGLNCALGPAEMRPYLETLHRIADCFISCYPNAGLPNDLGGYDLGPAAMAKQLREFASAGFINLVGGCCGTTPEHIAALADAMKDCDPRMPADYDYLPRFSGMEALVLRPEMNFINIGERTNVSGSRKFARLIRERQYEEALDVARQQVEAGAQIIDISMDEALLDSEAAMVEFLNLIAGEPDICRVPLMLDSSRWEVIEAGLRCVQGRCIVNSISLKDGEAEFRRRAKLARRYGAAIVVMAFDEDGQAVDIERRMEICTRSRRILRDLGFRDQEVIYDLNVLAVATGMEEHDDYSRSLLESIAELKRRFPWCLTSGGISNLSFSFRGMEQVREVMHTVFLYHAVEAGLDMGIINAGQLAVYDNIDFELRELAEDVILNRRSDASERLSQYAESMQKSAPKTAAEAQAWRSLGLDQRLAHAIVHGLHNFLEVDLPEAMDQYDSALQIVEGPLMAGMNTVGDLFGSGQMFLPQVVKSARVMKKAVAWLHPHLILDRMVGAAGRGKIVMATVKGDVHDIGKNIVGVIMGCNGYDVVDLGVMVPAADILAAAKEHKANAIGLSGLITPSLDEMVHVAQEMDRTGVRLPLLIGGATTSAMHTAVRIAPRTSNPVVYVPDASRAIGVLQDLLSPERCGEYARKNAETQEKLRVRRQQRQAQRELLSMEKARARAPKLEFSAQKVIEPAELGIQELHDFPLEELVDFIDWTPFFSVWDLKGVYPRILNHPKYGEEARQLLAEARTLLDRIVSQKLLKASAVYAHLPANSDGDCVEVYRDLQRQQVWRRFPMLRQQRDARGEQGCRSLADFVAPKESGVQDYVGLFALTVGHGLDKLTAEFRADHDDFHAILAAALADRLAEAFSERLHSILGDSATGIRPAPGYPACPDHRLKADIYDVLQVSDRIDMDLTENWSMSPAASVCGFYFAHPESCYFGVGRIGEDQLNWLAEQRELDLAETARAIGASWDGTLPEAAVSSAK